MKHKNNMREKPSIKAELPVTHEKKVTGEGTSIPNLDKKKDRIEIGSGTEHAGLGARMQASEADGVAHMNISKKSTGRGVEETSVGAKSVGEKKAWLKGSYESKKIIGNKNVKGKL
jgi:hypothetical protein